MSDRSSIPYRFHLKRKLRSEIAAVLDPGETVQVFVEKAIADEIARRHRSLTETWRRDELSSATLEQAPARAQTSAADDA